MTIAAQPLSLIIEITEATGFEIGHVYDDLVFVSHNVFLFRFTSTGERVELIFNRDCQPLAEERLTQILSDAAKLKGIQLVRKGYYTLNQIEPENMALEFFDNAGD